MESSEHWNEEDFFKWFYKITTSSWYEYAQNTQITDGFERQFLYELGEHAKKGTQPTIKQLRWAKRIVERFEIKEQPQKVIIRKRKGQKPKIIKNIYKNVETLHATVRMAWHDNKWNGKICSDPENNKYCVGDYSLLSNRLRRRRRLEIECKSGCKSQAPCMELMDGYLPPCYWSINAFGSEDIDVEHEHPMRESNINIRALQTFQKLYLLFQYSHGPLNFLLLGQVALSEKLMVNIQKIWLIELSVFPQN